jgi:hypothetical protein
LLRRTETNIVFYRFQGFTLSHPCLYCCSFLLFDLHKSGTQKRCIRSITTIILYLFCLFDPFISTHNQTIAGWMVLCSSTISALFGDVVRFDLFPICYWGGCFLIIFLVNLYLWTWIVVFMTISTWQQILVWNNLTWNFIFVKVHKIKYLCCTKLSTCRLEYFRNDVIQQICDCHELFHQHMDIYLPILWLFNSLLFMKYTTCC